MLVGNRAQAGRKVDVTVRLATRRAEPQSAITRTGVQLGGVGSYVGETLLLHFLDAGSSY